MKDPNCMFKQGCVRVLVRVCVHMCVCVCELLLVVEVVEMGVGGGIAEGEGRRGCLQESRDRSRSS